jgi:hypothetical protein
MRDKVTYFLGGKNICLRFSNPLIGSIAQAFFHLAQTENAYDYEILFIEVPEQKLDPADVIHLLNHHVNINFDHIAFPSSQTSIFPLSHDFQLIFWPAHRTFCCVYPKNVFLHPESPPGAFTLLYENTYDETLLPPNSGGVLAAVQWLLESFGIFILHAAYVELNGRHILIPGKGGAGKTTLALSLSLNGGYLYADDKVFVCFEEKGNLLVWPYPKKIAVTEQTVGFFPQLAKQSASYERHHGKYYFLAGEKSASSFHEPGSPEVLIFPHILESGHRPIAELLPPFKAFLNFLQDEILYPPVDLSYRETQISLVEALCTQAVIYSAHLGLEMDLNFKLLSNLIR